MLLYLTALLLGPLGLASLSEHGGENLTQRKSMDVMWSRPDIRKAVSCLQAVSSHSLEKAAWEKIEGKE